MKCRFNVLSCYVPGESRYGMTIYRLFPFTGDNHSYIERTGLSFDVIDDITDGVKIDGVDVRNMVVKNKTKTFPDLMGTGMTEFFVSERMKTFLTDHVERQDIHFVKVEIQKHDYWLLNIVGLRDCMDYERSQFTVYEKVNKPDHITKLVIREDEVSELDIFRLLDRPEVVFVTEPLKDRMEQQGFTGMRFFGGVNLTTFRS